MLLISSTTYLTTAYPDYILLQIMSLDIFALLREFILSIIAPLCEHLHIHMYLPRMALTTSPGIPPTDKVLTEVRKKRTFLLL